MEETQKEVFEIEEVKPNIKQWLDLALIVMAIIILCLMIYVTYYLVNNNPTCVLDPCTYVIKNNVSCFNMVIK